MLHPHRPRIQPIHLLGMLEKGVVREFSPPENDENIVYDNVNPPTRRRVQCVNVGKQKQGSFTGEVKQQHFVLIISPRPASRGEKEYERVGVGILPTSSIVFDEMQPEIQII
jgi:hypothetical protein